MNAIPVGGEIFARQTPRRSNNYEFSYKRSPYIHSVPKGDVRPQAAPAYKTASQPIAKPKPGVIQDVMFRSASPRPVQHAAQPARQPVQTAYVQPSNMTSPAVMQDVVAAPRQTMTQPHTMQYASQPIAAQNSAPVQNPAWFEAAPPAQYQADLSAIATTSNKSWAKQTLSYAGITIAALGAGLAMTDLRYGQMVIGLYALAALVFRINSQITFGTAMMSLIAVPASTLIGKEDLAEYFAVYSFLLLCVGVLSAIVELRTDPHHPVNQNTRPVPT